MKPDITETQRTCQAHPVSSFCESVSPNMVSICGMQLTAEEILRMNIEALRKRDGLSMGALGRLVGHRSGAAWLGRILDPPQNHKERRGMRLPDIIKVASVFGLEPYELFRPGLSAPGAAERRKHQRRTLEDRRSGVDRRIGHTGRLTAQLRAELNKVPHFHFYADAHAAVSQAVSPAIRALLERHAREIDAAIQAEAAPGGQASASRAGLSSARPRRRSSRRSDVESTG